MVTVCSEWDNSVALTMNECNVFDNTLSDKQQTIASQNIIGLRKVLSLFSI